MKLRSLLTPERSVIIPAFVIILISRIPFLFSGYGAEEDAWGLMVVARNIANSGVYEVSRLPGHPIQELFLSLVWQLPSWLLNLLTVFVSTLGFYLFYKTLLVWKTGQALTATVALAFTPVIFINSTNVMDYMWASSLVLAAVYYSVKNKPLLAGCLIGIAVGFRITSGAMLIPCWIIMLDQTNIKLSIRKIILSGVVCLVVSIIAFLPPYLTYGKSFFTYYEYFPYPPFAKNFYKGTIAAWGVIGMLALTAGLLLSLRKLILKGIPINQKRTLIISIITILLFTYSFIRIPQKAAFVIPMVPFVIIILTLFLDRKKMIAFTLAMVASSFLIGINLVDRLRGSSNSALAFKTKIQSAPVSIDLLQGPVIADMTKREQRIFYARFVAGMADTVQQKTVILAGWWLNEINWVLYPHRNNNFVTRYYCDKKELNDFVSQGYRIYYLPDQEKFNDLRFQGNFTLEYAKAFPY